MQVEMIEAARPTYHESRRHATGMRACDVQRACATSSQVMMIYSVRFDESDGRLFRFIWELAASWVLLALQRLHAFVLPRQSSIVRKLFYSMSSIFHADFTLTLLHFCEVQVVIEF